MRRRINIVHREPNFWDKHDDTRTKGYTALFQTLLKYGLSVLAIILIIGYFVGELVPSQMSKILILFAVAIILLAVYNWYVDIGLLMKRRRKYGRHWKPLKDPLIIETIIVIILVLIGLWLWN